MQELATVAETAGDWLSADEEQEARFWIKKIRRVPKESPKRPTRRELPADVLQSTASAVRGALKKTAREQTTTSWNQLGQQLGSALPHMTPAERIQVLTLVDQTTPADQALLSSLVAAGDPDKTTTYRFGRWLPRLRLLSRAVSPAPSWPARARGGKGKSPSRFSQSGDVAGGLQPVGLFAQRGRLHKPVRSSSVRAPA